MSRKTIGRAINSAVTHFQRSLKEFEFKVIPVPEVPDHIIKPQYALNPLNPQFSLYEGPPAILTPTEIQKIKKSARIAADTLLAAQKYLEEKAAENIANGTDGTITGEDIDKFVYNFIIEQGAYPTPIGFIGFPKSVCLSINECVVHGIPSMRPIYLGDKINMDVTAYFDGFHGDTNLTLIYGGFDKAPTPEIKNIVGIAQQTLYKAISICRPGVKFNEIGSTIERFAYDNGVHICEHFTGHGVGSLLHMPPFVYHVHVPSEKFVMKPGNTFTIEPVMSHYQSSTGLKIWSDGLTVISDNNPNAQFEHMILITETGCEVLTQREGENIPNPNGNIENLKFFK